MKSKKLFSPVFVIVMTIFIDISGFGIVLPLLPFYANSFGATPFSFGILVASFSVMQFIFAPILGGISDKIGRRPILLISIFFSGFSFVLFAVANSFYLLLISRLIAGMATESAVARAYIADITPKKERSAGIGKVGAAFGAGFIVGPVIGGLLSEFGFFGPGLAATILTVVNFVSVFLFLPESLNKKSNKSDIGFSSYWDAFKIGYKNPKIGLVLLINFIITLAFSAIPVILPLLGINLFNFKEVDMSYFFMYIGFVQIIIQGFLIGKLEKRFGEEIMIVLGSLLMAIGTFGAPIFANILFFVFCVSLIAGGIGVLNTAIPSYVSKRSSSKAQGGGMGLVDSVGSIARIPGPIIGGFMFEFGGLFVAFFLSTVFLVVAFALSCRIFQTCRL